MSGDLNLPDLSNLSNLKLDLSNLDFSHLSNLDFDKINADVAANIAANIAAEGIAESNDESNKAATELAAAAAADALKIDNQIATTQAANIAAAAALEASNKAASEIDNYLYGQEQKIKNYELVGNIASKEATKEALKAKRIEIQTSIILNSVDKSYLVDRVDDLLNQLNAKIVPEEEKNYLGLVIGIPCGVIFIGIGGYLIYNKWNKGELPHQKKTKTGFGRKRRRKW